MKKEEFLKQVTSFFSTQNFAELNSFLKENSADAVSNKKFINALNKEMGNDTISSSLKEIEAQAKAEKKEFVEQLKNAIQNNNEELLNNTLGKLSTNDQFKQIYDLKYLKKNSNTLFNKVIKNIIDNMEQLSANNQSQLANFCLANGSLDILEDIGAYYCKKNNNIENDLVLAMNKSSIIAFSEDRTAEQKSDNVNELYDLLQTHKKNDVYYNPAIYFANRPEQLIYLDQEKFDKVCIKNKLTPSDIFSELLKRNNSELAHYYLNKYDGKELIGVYFSDYMQATQDNLDTDKLTLAKNSQIHNLPHYLSNKRDDFFKVIREDKIQKVLEQNPKQIMDSNNFNLILGDLGKNDANYLFNETKIYKLSPEQKKIVDKFINKHDELVIDSLNGKNKNIYIGNKAIEEVINKNLENDSFIAKLNKHGKDSVATFYADYSKINDADKFIKNFLADTEPMRFSCFHLKVEKDISKDNEKEKLLKYILNEKTIFDNVNVHHAMSVYHLLDDKHKADLVKGFVEYKDYYEDEISRMKKRQGNFTKQEKENLEDINNLYEELSIEAAKFKPKKMKR